MTTYSEAVEQTITAGEQIHQIVNGTATTEVTVEDGSKVPSIRKALLDNFYFKDPIVWQVGQTENVFNQLRQFTDGSWWYAPSATASNPTSMGVTPVGDPLWKIYSFDAIGKLEPRIDEALRRSYAEAGYNVVGTFQSGFTYVTTNDVGIDLATGKGYTGPAGVVAAGTNPASGGFVDVSRIILRNHTILHKSSIPELVLAIDLKQGDVVSTGLTQWGINNSNGLAIANGLFAKPVGFVYLSDYTYPDYYDFSTIIPSLWALGFKLCGDGKYTAANVRIPNTFTTLIGGGVFDCGAQSRCFYQDPMPETPTTLQSNINRGNTTCVLSDSNIPIGAIVRLVSNGMISKKWTTSIVRSYYQEGEINKVIAKSGNTYTFETEFYFDYITTDMQSVSWYIPRDGVNFDVILKCNTSAVYSGNTGLEIWQQNNDVNITAKTENFNSQGVIVAQCWKPNIARVESVGGNDASEKNYALNIADGTRFAAVGLVRGNDTRHSITIGGSGRAVPLQGSVTKAFNTNTNKTSVALPGIDLHGNSGGFIFGECITDTTVTVAGVNNHIESAQCGDGWFTIAGDDGGFNCSIGTLKTTNPYRVTNAPHPMINLRIDHLNIEYSKVVADTQLNLNPSGTTSIGRLYVKNRGVDEATSNSDALNKVQPVPYSFRANTDIDSAEISGFSYIRFVGENCTVRKLVIDNCGWAGSVPTVQSTIYFQTSLSSVFVGQIVTKASNANLTYSNRLIGFSADAMSGITISNISGASIRPRVIDVPSTVSGIRLINNTLTGISSNASPSSRVWGWDGLPDT